MGQSLNQTIEPQWLQDRTVQAIDQHVAAVVHEDPQWVLAARARILKVALARARKDYDQWWKLNAQEVHPEEWKREMEARAKALEQQIADAKTHYEDGRKAGEPYDRRLADYLLRDVPGLLKELASLRSRLYYQAHPVTNSKRSPLGESQIAAAKAYPFESLLEFKNKRALCPFHPDTHPSFSLHRNRGTCWACGWRGDTVDFVMQIEGLSFPDAVRRLA